MEMEDDSLLLLPSGEGASVDLLHANEASNEYNNTEHENPETKGRKRERLTLGQKRQVVDLASSNQFTHRELAEKFQVGRTTITNICKNTELIRNETDSADIVKKKRKTTKCTYDLKILDEALHKWRMEVKVSNPEVKMTGATLQNKAMQLAHSMLADPYIRLPEKVQAALSKFSASNGWLDGYRTRFGSFSTRLTSDQTVIKQVDFQTRLREIHHILDNVDPQDIWTGSEFALVSKPPSATQPETSRLTVSLFVNAAGETFDLQVIGTERGGGPPCDMEALDLREKYRIMYDVSKTGWQVAHTCMHVLKQLNALAKSRKRHFHVILDSAVPHVKAAMMLDSLGDQRTFFLYESLRILFLPPNFNLAKCHPLHLGLITTFKARFRYEELDALFSRCRNQASLMDPQLQWTLKNVLHWLSVALHSLEPSDIVSTWIQSGLLPSSTVASVMSYHRVSARPSKAVEDLQWLLTEIAAQMPPFLPWIGIPEANAQLWIDMEGKASVTDPGVDDVQIIRSVLVKHGYLEMRPGNLEESVEGIVSSSANVSEPVPNKRDVWEAIDLLKRYVRVSGQAPHIPSIVALNALKSSTANLS
ncbi:hypothetical protein LEN26_011139 [Aphanomyces euteiches]|uniref:HTH CENPB-type domain-containing protein n=1 Tax=Aphanomyces euteiches TaxID=100861 RepID=A0A6G0WGM9_9STRA|nr:hypothetical protein Ae201684_015422 [Aphanomyces euteiches]KAH9097631.1 hypothetical protein Ae201684P_001107 [Aphanomyces euteiches]KAH9104791.1 hypothetical protein AeMF1_019262 [Aphanomyces euteiches]KAH9120363.1 hypothetical protein LEN26_011139 [Aphanomyces euteiches]KAH9184873.1 hypothetical protein AeNC1_013149 [Aphanomyces euteiches]